MGNQINDFLTIPSKIIKTNFTLYVEMCYNERTLSV